MSRSQKNVRRAQSASEAPMGGAVGSTPEGVTQKNGAENIAGTVDPNRITADDYKNFQIVKEDR